MTHWKLKAVSLLTGCLMLAGCSGGGGAPIGAPAADSTGGSLDVGGQKLQGDPIRVGFLVDQTGALADYGRAHLAVGEAAARRINENGGIDGRPLELDVVDTESDPSVAAPRARSLVQSKHVDFLLGSNTSSVVNAVAAVAKETKTVYFPTAGGALLGTPKNANRYVFDFNTNVKQETTAAANFAKTETPAKSWATVVADYAWGWDQETSFATAANADGLSITKQVRAPLGTNDFLGYLRGSVPANTEGIYFANFGTDFLAFIRDLKATHPDIVRIGGNYVLAGQDIGKLGDEAQGMYVVSGYPQNADAMNSKFDNEYRKVIGMDSQGVSEKDHKPMVASYQWSTWESLNAIKAIIEQSGWKSKADTMEFIKALEGHKFADSVDFPAGDSYFRPQDHLSIKDVWIEQVDNGALKIAKRVSGADIGYSPLVDYTK
jgi:branched-chain amino acid transport system substrate-binding protein